MWVKTPLPDDPEAAVKLVKSSHATGEVVLCFSQGTFRRAYWREQVRKETNEKKGLDERGASTSTVSA
jgi:hypothetical protein